MVKPRQGYAVPVIPGSQCGPEIPAEESGGKGLCRPAAFEVSVMFPVRSVPWGLRTHGRAGLV